MVKKSQAVKVATQTVRKGSLAASASAKRDAERLARTITGHMQGIERMIADERYCIDILKQVAAVKGLLKRLADTVSESHMKYCVRDAIQRGEAEAKINELMETLKYLRAM